MSQDSPTIAVAPPSGLRILAPLDGSRAARRALDYAALLPARRLTLLHIAPEALMLIPGISPGDDEGAIAAMTAELEDIARSLRNDLREVTVDVRAGDPAEEIIAAATDYDLVVMATHGRGAAGRLFFGSVADRVSRHGVTPTLMIRPTSDAPVPAPARIVAPLDGSARSERGLPLAAALARDLRLPLHLARVVGLDDVRAAIQESREAAGVAAAPADSTYEDAHRQAEDLATAYLNTVAAPLVSGGIDVHVDILEGTPAFALLDYVTAADLVVMTSHGRHGMRRWLLGSVAEKLVREARGPVLLAPTRDDAGTGGEP